MASVLDVRAGGASDKGPTRPANEDAYLLPEKRPAELGAVYVVADGVGGQQHGADAAWMATRIVHDSYYMGREEGLEVPEAVQAAFARANEAVYRNAQEREVRRMGCTMVAAVFHLDQLYVAHAGDSRAYLLREGHLIRLTRDDTWVEAQVEAGILSPDEAAEHEFRNVVTRVVGNKPTVEAHVSRPVPWQAGDILLLCSDGLYDAVSKQAMGEILATQEPQAAAKALIQAAIRADARDNITAVVVASSEAPATAGDEGDKTQLARTVPAPSTVEVPAEAATLVEPPSMPEPEPEPQPAMAEPTATPEHATLREPVAPPPAAPPTAGEPPTLRRPDLAPEKGGRNLGRLVAIAAVVVFALAAIAFVVVRLATSLLVEPGVADAIQGEASPSVAESPVAPAVVTVAPAATPEPPATAVAAEAEGELPTPVTEALTVTVATTATVASEAPATPEGNYACVSADNDQLFVWDISLLALGTCTNAFATAFLEAGEPVVVLEPTPQAAFAPDGLGSCDQLDFVLVQSETRPEVQGWVIALALDEREAGASCGP